MIAKELASQIRKKQAAGEPFVLAFSGGRSPRSVFKELVRMHKEEQLSFRNVIVFNVYEFYPLSASTNSNLAYLKESFLDQVDIDLKNINSTEGSMPKADIFEFSRQYIMERWY